MFATFITNVLRLYVGQLIYILQSPIVITELYYKNYKSSVFKNHVYDFIKFILAGFVANFL